MINRKLLQKLIKSDDPFVEFDYQNPLLNETVSQALSKSFVKLLKEYREDSSLNNNLRHSVLENIRKICTIVPEEHTKVSDSFTELLTNFYQKKIDPNADSKEKMIECFILKQCYSDHMKSRFQNSLSPEVIQALLNLDKENSFDVMSKEIIHWDAENNKFYNILKQIWEKYLFKLSADDMDSLCIKMRSEIERILLCSCCKILEDRSIDLDELFTDIEMNKIVRTAAISPICFQICTGTLNCVLLSCEFDCRILAFIPQFISHVKKQISGSYISTLYPQHLSTVVSLLDIDLKGIPEDHGYYELALSYIQKVHNGSEMDLITLLTHFPQWSDIYFKDSDSKRSAAS